MFSETEITQEASLPPAQGYVAEKASLMFSALRSLLKRVGLAVTTVDDARTPSSSNPRTPVTPEALLHPDASGGTPGASPVLLQNLVGQPIERVLHDAADFHDSRAMQVAHQAMEDERLQRHYT